MKLSFFYRSTLAQHKKIHNRQIECDVCKKMFATNQGIIIIIIQTFNGLNSDTEQHTKLYSTIIVDKNSENISYTLGLLSKLYLCMLGYFSNNAVFL